MAANIFTYAKPGDQIQKNHNKEASALLGTKHSQLILEYQSIGTGFIPAHKYKGNFLDFYSEFVENNKLSGNRHLEGSFTHFKNFLGKDNVSPIEITEDLSQRFRKYLLDKFNGDTPANYFSRFKKVLHAATKQGYFRNSPTEDVAAKSNKNKRRREIIEADEYIKLLKTPCLNQEVKEAFVFCCYTGLRWCDVKSLNWKNIRGDSIVFYIIQEKTTVEHRVTLHAIARAILDQRRKRLGKDVGGLVFKVPRATNSANAILGQWCNDAKIAKHITWHCARHSFSILLQDAKVDPATVALLLGQTSTRYVYETYKRYRPADHSEFVQNLPTPKEPLHIV